MEEHKMYLQKDAIENILKNGKTQNVFIKDAIENILKNGRSQNVFIDRCNRKYIEKWKNKKCIYRKMQQKIY